MTWKNAKKTVTVLLSAATLIVVLTPSLAALEGPDREFAGQPVAISSPWAQGFQSVLDRLDQILTSIVGARQPETTDDTTTAKCSTVVDPVGCNEATGG